MNPLIQGLFSSFKTQEELDKLKDDDAFELFASSLVLSDEAIAQGELTDLLLDAGTTGIDTVVIEVNGHIVRDTTDLDDIAGTASKIDVVVHFIQAKRSHHIQSSDILGFGSSIEQFLENEGFDGYPALRGLAALLATLFQKYAGRLRESPSISAHFVTTAPAHAVQEELVQQRCDQAAAAIRRLGFVGTTSVVAWGSEDLHSSWSSKNNANTAEVLLEKQVNLPKMPGVDQAILSVVSVAELLKMIKNGSMLDERIFYDNVRGFKGTVNRVNKKILATIKSTDSALLPVLNNGITVVASSYAPKPGDAVVISDYQIVNGCQTSHCLFLSEAEIEDPTAIYVPLRLVVTADAEVANKIVQATNSQTEVGENDLVALTRFQKQLEDFYRLDTDQVGLTYERRSGQYFGKEVVKTRVVTINDQIRAAAAVALNLPHSAARYANRLYNEIGTSIFKDDHKLLPYLASAFTAYKLETAFRTGLESQYKSARYHLMMVYAFNVLGEGFAPLNSVKAEKQAGLLIESLKQPDQVSLFRSAAAQIVEVNGDGDLPSRDRLKRQQFTQELDKSLRERRAEL